MEGMEQWEHFSDPHWLQSMSDAEHFITSISYCLHPDPLRTVRTHAAHCTVKLTSVRILLNVDNFKCNYQKSSLVTL